MFKYLKKAFSIDRLMGVGLLAVLAAVYIADPYPLQFTRVKIFDFYQQQKPRPIPPLAQQPVTIIDLDEESLAEVGQWPWPRTIVAKMVHNAFKMGAILVAFDVVFAEPDRLNPSVVAESMVGLDPETKKRLNHLPSNDQYFANVIRRTRVVLGQAGYWEDIETNNGPPVKKSVALLASNKNVDPKRFLPEFQSLVRNVPVIEPVAAGHGIFSLVPEPDGIVRRVPTVFMFDGGLYPSLSIEMLRVATGKKTILVKADPLGVTKLGVHKQLQIPTDRRGRVWPYFSKRDTAKYIKAKDILAGTVDPKRIKGKMAIVGTSAVGLLDIRAVPTEPVIPGVEVHVQLIESVFNKAFLSRPNNVEGAEFILLVVGGLLMIWLVPSVGAKWTMMLFLVIITGAAGTSWYLFSEKQLLFDASYAGASIFCLYTFLTYTSYAREEKERQQVRDAFGFYLSPDMVEKLAEDPDQLTLGGESRDMTLLFCDVRGFTTISEQFDAEGLTLLINKLLTPLTNVIMSNNGTVDKYMGDCIMAFWNAPLDNKMHARDACISALGMMAEMGPLNDRLEQEAIEDGRKFIPLKVGIGLNSGDAVVGNMGSDQRFDYSVLGDTVNLASRLEGQSKAYGVDIVIGDETNNQVQGMATLELDLIKVKGKTEAVRIFTLQGDETVAQSPDFLALKPVQEEMLEAYRAQDWDRAAAKCQEARELAKGKFNMDGFWDLYDDRIADYKSNPPGADWDGVFVATSK